MLASVNVKEALEEQKNVQKMNQSEKNRSGDQR